MPFFALLLATAASAQNQMGMQHMEMESPQKIAPPPPVVSVQEPENPDQQSGSYVPVPDLLAEAAKVQPKKLADFEHLAAANNPTLKQAEAIVRASAGQARQAGLWPNPTIGYQGQEIRGGAFGGGEQGGFIQQNIVLGGKLGLRRNVFEQQRKSDEIRLQEQKLNVLGAVRVEFYAALAAQRSVETQRQLLKIAMDAAATAHQLANVGQADAPDVLQTEVEAERAKLDFSMAQRQYIQSFQTLTAVAGQPGMPLAPLQGDLDHPPQINADAYMQELLANSPSIKRAQQDAQQAEAVLRRDKRETVPDLSVNVGGEQNLERNEPLRTPVGYQSFATVGVQIPIFNRNQGNVQAARAQLELAQQEITRVQLNLAQSAQPLLQQYLNNQLQAEHYRTQIIPRAQRAYELYLGKYRNMAAAYPEVIISQRTLFQLEEDYTRSLAALWTAAVQLQNYMYADGLKAPMPGASPGTEINLPTSGSGSRQ